MWISILIQSTNYGILFYMEKLIDISLFILAISVLILMVLVSIVAIQDGKEMSGSRSERVYVLPSNTEDLNCVRFDMQTYKPIEWMRC